MPELDPNSTTSATDRLVIEAITVHEQTILQPADHQVFFAALDTPSTPTDMLRTAFERHREVIARR